MPMITSTKGMLDDENTPGLVKSEELIDNDNEITTVTIYHLHGELVHRSVHVSLKKWPEGMQSVVADMG